MFELPIGNMLNEYIGYSENYEFSDQIEDGFFENIVFESEISFSINILKIKAGLIVTLKHIEGDIVYKNKKFNIAIEEVHREFRENKPKNNFLPDDIKFVNKKKNSIDLKDFLYEEIMMIVIHDDIISAE